MKPLIIFYSFEGNTKLIAEKISQTIGAEVLELKPKKEIKTKGFMKYFWGGKQVLTKVKPELLPFDVNFDDYDFLFIGTPVWAGSYAPALNSFFADHKFSNKKIALFCCHGGGKGKVFDKMKTVLEGNEIISEIDFHDPKKKNTEAQLQKAEDWAKEMNDYQKSLL